MRPLCPVRLVLPGQLLLLAGCTNSSLGQPDLGDDTCPYEGEWALLDVSCGSFGAFAPFYERFDHAALVLTSAQAGCTAQVTLEGGECVASERWALTFDEVDPEIGELQSTGILTCDPVGCSFGAGSCLPGVGAGTGSVTMVLGDQGLVVSGGMGAAGADLDCPLGLTATFATAL